MFISAANRISDHGSLSFFLTIRIWPSSRSRVRLHGAIRFSAGPGLWRTAPIRHVRERTLMPASQRHCGRPRLFAKVVSSGSREATPASCLSSKLRPLGMQSLSGKFGPQPAKGRIVCSASCALMRFLAVFGQLFIHVPSTSRHILQWTPVTSTKRLSLHVTSTAPHLTKKARPFEKGRATTHTAELFSCAPILAERPPSSQELDLSCKEDRFIESWMPLVRSPKLPYCDDVRT